MLTLLRRALTPMAVLPLLTVVPLQAVAGNSWMTTSADDRCEAAATYFKNLSTGTPPAQTPADVAELWRRARHYATVEYQTPERAIVTVSKSRGAKEQVRLPLYKTVADCQGFLEFIKNIETLGKPQGVLKPSKPRVARPEGPLTIAPDWFVISDVRQCEPVEKYFKPLDQPTLSPDTPSDVAELLRMRGNTASVKFVSASAVIVEMQQQKPNEPQSWSFYPSMNLCERYLAALNDVRIAGNEQPTRHDAKRSTQPQQGSGFGLYRGKASNIEIGLETKNKGTALVIVNHGSTPFSVAPRDFEVQTSTGDATPCTFHLFSLAGMGAPSVPITVAPGKREGVMLGACMSEANDGAMTSPFIVRAPVTAVQLGKITVPVALD